MKIEFKKVKIREVVDGYVDNQESGVIGYGGYLNIRPAYQREFVYKDAQRDAVIETVFEGFPLNSMYWANNEGELEVLDGQQRTLSICQYVNGDFSYKGRYFSNLFEDEQEKFLDYELFVYICEGTESEKLNWFRRINIAGEKLTEQELRNSVYTGAWLSDAKVYFSKRGCVAFKIGSDYLNGSPIRQDYLEAVIDWISGGDIEGYMATHQHDPGAAQLWMYFQNVITWVQTTFKVKRTKFMKGIAWGVLYNKYGTGTYDANAIEEEIKTLMMDDDVTNKKGIYAYILDREVRHLSIRQFTDSMKQQAYERQGGICPICGKEHPIEQMEGDHITPWIEGGKTTIDNLQMLCKDCNRRKGCK